MKATQKLHDRVAQSLWLDHARTAQKVAVAGMGIFLA